MCVSHNVTYKGKFPILRPIKRNFLSEIGERTSWDEKLHIATPILKDRQFLLESIEPILPAEAAPSYWFHFWSWRAAVHTGSFPRRVLFRLPPHRQFGNSGSAWGFLRRLDAASTSQSIRNWRKRTANTAPPIMKPGRPISHTISPARAGNMNGINNSNIILMIQGISNFTEHHHLYSDVIHKQSS